MIGKTIKITTTDVRNALKCPRFFVLNKLKRVSMPYTKGLGVGNLVHDTLDDFIKEISEITEFPEYYGKVRNKADIIVVNERLLYELYLTRISNSSSRFKDVEIAETAWKLLDATTQKFATIIKKGLDRFPIEEVPRQIILGSERSFQVPLSIKEKDFLLTGRIDLLLRDPETREVTIIDYKTGSVENIDQDALQLVCYSMGIEQEFKEKSKIRILYLFEDGVRDVPIGKSEDLEPQLRNFLPKMAEWLENYPNNVPKGKCINCPLQERCYEIFDNIKPSEQVKKDIRKRIDELTGEIGGIEKLPSRSTEIELGKNLDNDEIVKLRLDKFTRHIAILGSSGSGKTVLSKVIIEEMLNTGISALIIDPQGDLASLAVPKGEKGKELLSKIDVSIFTPGSNKGRYLALDPFADPPEDLGQNQDDYDEYKNIILDNISSNLLGILDIDLQKAKAEKSFLEAIINEIWNRGERPSFRNIATLAETIEEVTPIDGKGKIPVDSLLSKSKRRSVCSKLLSYAVGTDGLLFQGGTNIPLDQIESGKPKLYVIHLGSIGTDKKKRINVVSWIVRVLYNWMLTNPPSNTDEIPRLLFYIDEVADFLPIHPYNPPSKRMLDLLLRQARKYGVSCMFATQSPGGIEYRALDNVLSLLVGRTPTKQSNDKIHDIVGPKIDNSLDRKALTARLMKADKGEFMLVSEDGNPQYFKSRMPYTQHKILDVDKVGELYKKEKLI